MIETLDRDMNPRPKIMIVDDDISTCETLSVLLSATYDCSIAHDLFSAREALSQRKDFNVVLLDLTLPDGYGDLILEEVKNSPVQVVVLTMLSDIRRAAALMSCGAFYYMTKNTQNEEILSIVARANTRAIEKRLYANQEMQITALTNKISSLSDSIRQELWHFSVNENIREGLSSNANLKDIVQAFEKSVVLSTLERLHYSRNKSAKALGIHINTLLLKIRQYGLTHRIPKRRLSFGERK